MGLATKGIFLKEEAPVPEEHRFASDYQELMWLAERERHNPSPEERRRFYQLRDKWPLMHLRGAK